MIPPFVDGAWLAAQPDAVLADVRWYPDGRSARAGYAGGHLPGALFVDLDTVLSAPPDPAAGRHPLPDPAAFAARLAALGIGDDDTVVGYDDAGGVLAARLVWLLRATGHEAAVLDGGPVAGPGSLTTAVPARRPGRFTPRPWPQELLADAADAADPHNTVLDARPAGRYRGEPDPLDPRPGHIPGARSLPTREHLGPDGRLLPAGQLRSRFTAAGVADADRVVSYCGSGVTACHNLLVMEQIGLGRGRLYPGSWSHYAGLTGAPVATGDQPG